MLQSQKEKEIQRIVNTITKAICEQQIPPGTRLVEAQLVDCLQANRNHIRSALQRLTLKRLVTIKANVGASVTQPSFGETKDIFAARLIVERGIIETLINRLTEMDVTLLRKQLNREKSAIQANSRVDIIRESGRFHLLLAKLCKNAVLDEMLNDLIARSSLIIFLYQQHDKALCFCNEHDQIIHHIENKEAANAIACLGNHLQHLELLQNMSLWKGKTVDLKSILGKQMG